MEKKFILLASLGVALTVAVVACNNISVTEGKAAVTAKDTAGRAARGEYLVTTTGCDDCHSPKRMGAHGPELVPELRLSGFRKDGKLPPADVKSVQNGWMLFAPDLTAAVGPWGISYAANLTSDQTGIGNWKEENFIRAMREGKAKGIVGNRDLLPPMPWFNFRHMTDEDLKSIYAYLKTTTPVNNVVPQPVPPASVK
jgi:mono/diheme cytochrome c family protein